MERKGDAGIRRNEGNGMEMTEEEWSRGEGRGGNTRENAKNRGEKKVEEEKGKRM